MRDAISMAIMQFPTFPWYSFGTIVEDARHWDIRSAVLKLCASEKTLRAPPALTCMATFC